MCILDGDLAPQLCKLANSLAFRRIQNIHQFESERFGNLTSGRGGVLLDGLALADEGVLAGLGRGARETTLHRGTDGEARRAEELALHGHFSGGGRNARRRDSGWCLWFNGSEGGRKLLVFRRRGPVKLGVWTVPVGRPGCEVRTPASAHFPAQRRLV